MTVKEAMATLTSDELKLIMTYFNRGEPHMIKLKTGEYLACNSDEITNFKTTTVEGFWSIGDISNNTHDR